MDPDSNLAEQRRISKELMDLLDRTPDPDDSPTSDAIFEKANRLAELCQALDQWIMRQGALPTEWHAKQVGNFQPAP